MEEKGGPLDVCEASSRLEKLPGVVDLGARGGRKLAEFSGELIGMVGGATIEVDEIPVDVVDDFKFGLWLCQEQGAAAGEGLDVPGLGGNVGQEALEVPGFASWPGNDG